MALFKKDKTTQAPLVTTNEASTKKTKSEITSEFSWVLIGPRITEKAAFVGGDNAYVFNVDPRANKIQIKKAVALQYKVTPVKVNIVHRDTHTDTKRGRKVHVKESKKAIIFLKKGQTIELA